jgi:PrtD family type I secretion system ABC transporter
LIAPSETGSSMHSDIMAALKDCRQAFWSVALFSAVVNMLMLAGPLYMLQIYDRVLSSRSVPTLVALSVFLVGAYLFQGALDIVRSRIVVRAAALLDRRLGTTVHKAVLHLAIQSRHSRDAQQPVRDLDQIRAFLTSPGPIAIVDLPWMPVFLVICFLVHPWLGFVAFAGAVLLIIVTILNERASRAPARVVSKDAGLRAAMIETDRRNSETVIAMGMAGTLAKRWIQINDRYLKAVGAASDVVSTYGSISKILRLLLQSAILGFGAYLVIRQELTAGSMIAASIMMGRALAPIETAIANWRTFIAARQSATRLSGILAKMPSIRASTALPKPSKGLEVEKVTVAAPGSATAILKDAHFRLGAGEVLGVIGPNGAGKTSLIRTLAGIWSPARGEVRIDGAPFDQWDPEFIGRDVGYVPQVAELFEGTIAENISRMAASPDSEAVLRAARAAGVHEMVLRLPSGYDARIGESGAVLSAGQRQRIAIARALFGEPFLILFDEPNSNLDSDGETALLKTVTELKARGAIVIIVAHRPSALAVCDKVLYLASGLQLAFGPRDEVLQKVLIRPAQKMPVAGPSLKIVGDAPGRDDR